MVDVPQLRQHAVNVQPLHEHPCEGAHVEVVEEDGDDGAHKLEGDEDGGDKISVRLLLKHKVIAGILNFSTTMNITRLGFIFFPSFCDNQFPSDFNLPFLQARLLTCWTGQLTQTAAFG